MKFEVTTDMDAILRALGKFQILNILKIRLLCLAVAMTTSCVS